MPLSSLPFESKHQTLIILFFLTNTQLSLLTRNQNKTTIFFSLTSHNTNKQPKGTSPSQATLHYATLHYIFRRTMRSKTHQTLNLKLLILAVLVAVFLLLVLRSSFSNSTSSNQVDLSPAEKTSKELLYGGSTTTETAADCSQLTCSKIPPSLSEALIHYATSAITPQQTLKEISVSARVLEKRSPCNFLVFGLGHDSLMWSALNHGGRTVFLEEDEAWIEQMRRRFPLLESYHVRYDSKVNEAVNLMDVGRGAECTAVGDPRYSVCQLALKGLPTFVYETKWDLIMVDAPTGYYEEAPGRMTAIYTAGMMARNREIIITSGEATTITTDVFVHDVNRVVEDKFSKAFLCDKYMKKQEGRLRHFSIPSHRDDLDRPFCPP